MGTIGSFENLMEFSCKQPNRVLSYAESYPCRDAVHAADVKDDQYHNSIIHKELEEGAKCTVSDSSGKLLDQNKSSLGEEDFRSGSGVTNCSSLFPPYFDHNYPTGEVPTTYSCDVDKRSSILDVPPRKLIPVGPNHQATLPAWNPQPLVGDKNIINELSVDDGFMVGEGRKDCCCHDAGSVSCVQKHIKEASDKLKEDIGNEKSEQLGLYEMGEEVALNWTKEEEEIFHHVVYGNPISSDGNFWKHLSLAFPYRTKKEIVSYYFNVFILRRRAVQNRSNFLSIDSDSDEWQGINVNEDNTRSGISSNPEPVAKDVIKQPSAPLESRYNNIESWNGSLGENGYLFDACDVGVWGNEMKGDDLFLPSSCSMFEEISREESSNCKSG